MLARLLSGRRLVDVIFKTLLVEFASERVWRPCVASDAPDPTGVTVFSFTSDLPGEA